jgi:hypothetical protein
LKLKGQDRDIKQKTGIGSILAFIPPPYSRNSNRQSKKYLAEALKELTGLLTLQQVMSQLQGQFISDAMNYLLDTENLYMYGLPGSILIAPSLHEKM